ncbi:MAG: four helix bundle protein [Ulvibacter sp.]|jgi:four helix bundle protein
MHKVEDLKIWKKSMDLVKSVYLLTYQLPTDEKFGLNSQIKRCSVSIPSNIAEGTGRNSNK